MTKSVKSTNTELFHVINTSVDKNYMKNLQFLYYLLNLNVFSVTLILPLELLQWPYLSHKTCLLTWLHNVEVKQSPDRDALLELLYIWIHECNTVSKRSHNPHNFTKIKSDICWLQKCVSFFESGCTGYRRTFFQIIHQNESKNLYKSRTTSILNDKYVLIHASKTLVSIINWTDFKR